MTESFSAAKRTEILKGMSSKALDVLVIGGGITGAGIALDAVSRGLQVGLVEMQDFAAGTSSRSTKLVHGGLRYLKQLEVKLVAEVGKERAIVYENAPHVTTPEWMLLPIFKGGTFGTISTSLGLRVYDFLAGVEKKERRKMLSRDETLKREPLLKKDGLKGSGIYVEYKTDDARLTLEIMKKAFEQGAQCVNFSQAERLLYEGRKVVGVIVRDRIEGTEYPVFAKKIVNATGPWVDTVREKDRSKSEKQIFLTKGIHIVVDRSRFPLNQAVYFDTEDDGRMIFAIPRDGKVYIGTTDTYYEEDYANPKMTEEDLEYVLDATNYMFPEVKLLKKDVESSWAGLRPLIYEKGKKASEISRKDEVFVSDSGLISIAGGKLTGYRKMAEKVVDRVCRDLGLKALSKTEKLTLSGGDVGGVHNFENFSIEQVKIGMELGLEEKVARRLVKLYGSNVRQLFSIMERDMDKFVRFGLPKGLYASLIYGIEEEMTVTPVDFFYRRTSAIIFDITWVKQWMEPIIACMQDYFNWSENNVEKYRAELMEELIFAGNSMESASRLLEIQDKRIGVKSRK